MNRKLGETVWFVDRDRSGNVMLCRSKITATINEGHEYEIEGICGNVSWIELFSTPAELLENFLFYDELEPQHEHSGKSLKELRELGIDINTL